MRLKRFRSLSDFTIGLVSLAVLALVLVLVWLQFRGAFVPSTQLTMLAARAGLSMDAGARVTYNGVQIGWVTKVEEITQNGEPKAKFTLEVDPKYIELIPVNVHAQIDASTAFGNKYVVFSTPKYPSPQHISPRDVIDASHVTTEFNSLFETVVGITEKIDPVKLNITLTNLAQALDGLGGKFGQSLANGNDILADVNARMPQFDHDVRQLANLADVYSAASQDLWGFLQHAVTTARSLTENQANLDAALMAAIGFGNTGGEIFERSGPYLRRGLQDLIPTSRLADDYSPELLCFVRNLHDLAPKVAKAAGGNGYAGVATGVLVGGADAWVYPDNLPRVNARGGPEGRPGCWQRTSRDLWPAPYLVMDNGASIAPDNHLGIGTPWAMEYVWGRQMGENTINP